MGSTGGSRGLESVQLDMRLDYWEEELLEEDP